jgi:hypothetical protein
LESKFAFSDIFFGISDHFEVGEIDRPDNIPASDQFSSKMAPFPRLPPSLAAAKEAGLSAMTSFFSPKVEPGRPPKKASKAGRPRAEKDVAPPAAGAAPAPAPAEAEPMEKKVKATRHNWSKGKGLKRMSDA